MTIASYSTTISKYFGGIITIREDGDIKKSVEDELLNYKRNKCDPDVLLTKLANIIRQYTTNNFSVRE